jgi:pteridine reductase
MPDNRYSLDGRIAMVTGGAIRIGRAIVRALANERCNVLVHHNKSNKEADDLVGELRDKGTQAWSIHADFTRPDDYSTLIDRAIDTAGSLDIIVNSASVFSPGTIDDIDFDDITKNFEINAWVPFVLMRDFARRMGKGKIVNILDTRFKDFDFKHIAYIMAKKMLNEFTRMAAVKYAPDITVNAVAPGVILPPPDLGDEYVEKLIPTVLLKKRGWPEDVAGAVVYLLQNDFITGQTIFVDGGRHLKEFQRGSNPD